MPLEQGAPPSKAGHGASARPNARSTKQAGTILRLGVRARTRSSPRSGKNRRRPDGAGAQAAAPLTHAWIVAPLRDDAPAAATRRRGTISFRDGRPRKVTLRLLRPPRDKPNSERDLRGTPQPGALPPYQQAAGAAAQALVRHCHVPGCSAGPGAELEAPHHDHAGSRSAEKRAPPETYPALPRHHKLVHIHPRTHCAALPRRRLRRTKRARAITGQPATQRHPVPAVEWQF